MHHQLNPRRLASGWCWFEPCVVDNTCTRMATQLELLTDLLRAVSGHINSTHPQHCKNVVLSVSEQGMAAESDERLSLEERGALAKSLDVYLERLLGCTSGKQGEGYEMHGLVQLSWVVSNCCESRFVQSFSSWGTHLLDMIKHKDTDTQVESVACQLLVKLFKRLDKLIWVQGVKKTASPLASKTLQTMIKKITRQGINAGTFVMYGKVTVGVIQSLAAQTQHIDGALESIAPKLICENATDAQRLLASELLGAVLTSTKDRRQWSAIIRQLLSIANFVLDEILGAWEVDVGKSMEGGSWESVKGAATLPGAIKYLADVHISGQNLAPAFKVFAGVWDALERLLTLPIMGSLPVPTHHIFALVARLLAVDLTSAKRKFKTTPNSLALFGRLTALHVASLEMLGLLCKVTRTQMLPMCNPVAGLLKEALHKLAISSSKGRMGMEATVRAALYAAVKTVTQLGGFPLVDTLAADAIACFQMEHSRELGNFEVREDNTSTAIHKSGKKRKSISTTESDLLAADVELAIARSKPMWNGAGVPGSGALRDDATQRAQEKAMNMVEAFFTVGGVTLKNQIRQTAEKAISRIVVATMNTGIVSVPLCRALLAAVLSPCQGRSRLMPLACQVLNKGRCHPNPTFRSFCYEASDQIEAILHPRAVSIHAGDATTAGVEENEDPREYLAIPLQPRAGVLDVSKPNDEQGTLQKIQEQKAAFPEATHSEQRVFSRCAESDVDLSEGFAPPGSREIADPADDNKSSKRARTGPSLNNNTELSVQGPSLSLKGVGAGDQGSSLRSAFAQKTEQNMPKVVPGRSWELQGVISGAVVSDDDVPSLAKEPEDNSQNEGVTFKAPRRRDSEESDSEGSLPEIDSGMSDEDG